MPATNPTAEAQALYSPFAYHAICHLSDEAPIEEVSSFLIPIKFDPLSPLIWKLEELNDFTKQKWEELEYVQPAPLTIKNTVSFLASLGDEILLHLTPEDLSVTNYGTVTMEFYFGLDYLSVEVGLDQIGYYTKSNILEIKVLNGKYFDGENIPNEVSSAFERFLAHV